MTDQRESGGNEPHVNVDDLIHHTELPRNGVSNFLDSIVRWAGYGASWFCWLTLVGIIVVNVVMRHFFGEGKIYFEEAQSFIYALGFLIGLSFCVENDSHIRIDIFHDRFKPRTKAWIDFIGIIFFLIPYVLIILIYSPPLIEYSIETGERSTSPGGLPFPLITIWKSFMFIGYALLMIAGISRLIRATSMLFGQSNLNSTAR